MSRPLAPSLCLLLALTGSARAASEPSGAGVRRALAQVLPGQDSPEARAAGAGMALALAAPRGASRLAERTLEALEARIQDLAAALKREGAGAATGPLHRQLELRHLDAGDGRAVLTQLAEALERSARDLSPEVGTGRLRTTLALEEVLRLARSDLTSLARSLRQSAEVALRGRLGLARMLALVEEVQDKHPASDRERVRLEVRPGSTRRLHAGLESLGERYRDARKGLDQVTSLMQVRSMALEEALRNLAGGDPRPHAPAVGGGEALVAAVEAVRDRLRAELARLGETVAAVEAGREVLPELPPLPDWLFTPAGQAPPPAPPGADEALELLDELERDMDRETMVLDDPLTSTMVEDFRDRHGLPASEVDEVAALLEGLDR